MQFSGQILKMCTQNGKPIQYYLNLGNDLIMMNQLIGKTLTIKHIGYQCLCCDSDEKIYRMGFCKKCFFESPYASDTISVRNFPQLISELAKEILRLKNQYSFTLI